MPPRAQPSSRQLPSQLRARQLPASDRRRPAPGRGVRVSRGLYRLLEEPPGPTADLPAWQLALPPTGAFTHLTAALVRDWWLPPLPADVPVFAAVPDGSSRPRRNGLVACRHAGPVGFDTLGGLRVATPPEILLAAGRDLGLLDLVVLTDAALQRGDSTIADLRAAARQRRRGAPALRRALALADGRSESPWETMLRLLHAACDVAVTPQFEIRGENGAVRARGDLRIDRTRRLAEYDGEGHRSAAQHARDLVRERFLQRSGWQRYGYTADGRPARRGLGAPGRRRCARAGP